ncbi:MAG: M14 family metallopeptidase [Synergistales bacterium]
MNKSSEILSFETSLGARIKIPLGIVEGKQPGPTAIVTAGVHGCEYCGIVAAMRLFRELDPQQVHGTVKIIPVTSTLAFEERSMFTSPADRLNLNRMFPGDPNGSYSQVLAYHFMDIVKHADYHIDLHGGDMVEDLEPFSIYHCGEGKELDGKSYEIAKYYGLPNIVSTFTDGPWPDNGTTYANVSRKLHIPSAIVEVGGKGILDHASIQMHLTGLYNVLKHFGNLDGVAEEISGIKVFSNMKWVYSNKAGVFFLATEVGKTVEEGQFIGHVETYFGEVIEEVFSTARGKVLFTTTSPAVKENGLLLGIGTY